MNENQLLAKISELYSSLQNTNKGTYIGTTQIAKPGEWYQRKAKELLNKVIELHVNYHPSYINGDDIASLQSTMGKEVAHVEVLFQKTLNSRSSQKTERELYQAIYQANDQIRRDLYRVLEEIKKIEQKP